MAINDRTTAKPGHKHYEELAEEIARQIAANVLRPGDRLPSIRQTCRTRHLSPSTVFQAYDLLENRGLIRAAPRSGYFVNPPPSTQAPEPAMSTPPEGAHSVEITDLVIRRTAPHQRAAVVGQNFRPARPRDALLVLLQDAVTGIPSWVGRSRPVCQQRAPVEAHDQFVGLRSSPGHSG